MSSATVVEQVVRAVDRLRDAYERLVVLAGPAGSGKTVVLREFARRRRVPLVNVNLELSRRLLDETVRGRRLRVREKLAELIEAQGASIVALDNTEILFHPDLRVRPLELFRAHARNQRLVVTWNGRRDGTSLVYADPDHPEYRREDIEDTVVIDVS